MGIIIGNGLRTPHSNTEGGCISFHANALGESMNPIRLPNKNSWYRLGSVA